jgi:hypothetical protein
MALLMVVGHHRGNGSEPISRNRQRLGVLVSEAPRREILRLRYLGCGSSEKEVDENGS